MVKKNIKLLTIGVIVIMVFGFLTGCRSKMPYNAKMFGAIYENRTWINDEFYNNNLTYGSYSSVLENYVEDETYPSSRTKIIVDKADFDTIFEEFPVEVDFEKEMIVMHCFTTASGSSYTMKSIIFNEKTLTINYKTQASKKPASGNASMPLSKWVIVMMDKLDIETAEFIFAK